MPTLKHKDEVYGAGSPTSLSQLSDVNLSNLQNGQVPMYNSTTQEFENADLPTPPTPPSDLADLSDVTLATPTNGQALRYNGNNWVNAEALHKTTATSCVIGDTTVTFTDANILTTSEICPYAETSSGTPVTFTSCVVSVDGTAVLTFPALTEVASIYLKITNY